MNTMTNDALATAPGTADMTDASRMPGESLQGNSSLAGSGGHERIHRFTGMLHKAIDKVDQGLVTRSSSLSSHARGGQGQEYRGSMLRSQISERPLRTAGIALGTYVLFRKLLKRTPDVQMRVVQVPVPTPARADFDRPARRWTDTAAARAKGFGQGVKGTAGAAAGAGFAGTKAVGSSLARSVSALPLHMRRATDNLRVKGRTYGAIATDSVRAHPVAGLGTLAGAGALLTLWLSRRKAASPSNVGAYDYQADGGTWRGLSSLQTGARDAIATRPVASAAVILGVGAVMGAMLRR